jgi:general secretion pathway protein L
MSEAVLIRPSGLPDVWEWARLATDAARDAFRGSLTEIARRCGNRRVVVVVPGTDVTLHRVQVPARSPAEIRMAVPFALEEQLAGKIEGLHFAVGSKAADGTVPVAVMSHDTLRGYLQPLIDAGIQPQSVIPEQLALPWHEGECSVLIDAVHAVVRTGSCEGFSVDNELLAEMLRRAGQPDAQIQMWFDHDEPQAVVAAKAAASVYGSVAQRRLPPVSAALYAEALQTPANRIEILQGEHRIQGEGGWGRWRPALLVAAGALLLHVGWSLWDSYSLGRDARALQVRSEELFRSTFPEVKRVVDVGAQAEQQLRALVAGSATGDFPSLFAHAGSVLMNAPSITVEGFTFKDGALTLNVSGTDAAGLKSVADQIGQVAGARASVTDEQQTGSGVSARIVIRAVSP